MSRPRARLRRNELTAVPDNAVINERMCAVVDLIGQGFPVAEVAKQLGVGHETVRRDFHRAMARTLEEMDLNTAAYRQKQVAEIDAMKGILWDKMQAGSVKIGRAHV